MTDDLEPPDPPEREHGCCDNCGRGSCPGSGSRGADACTYWYVRGRSGVEQSPSSAAVGSDPDPTASTNPPETVVVNRESLLEVLTSSAVAMHYPCKHRHYFSCDGYGEHVARLWAALAAEDGVVQ